MVCPRKNPPEVVIGVLVQKINRKSRADQKVLPQRDQIARAETAAQHIARIRELVGNDPGRLEDFGLAQHVKIAGDVAFKIEATEIRRT
jgi:hypothetical protein